MPAIEFLTIRCPCGAVFGDCLGFRGIFRGICPGCKKRITLHGDGHKVTVAMVTNRPPRLPRPPAVVI